MTSNQNLHVSLATALTAEIEQGLWSDGQRLPSVRQLAQTRRVSVTTVLAAYRLMEDRRLVEARPQKGFFVRTSAHRPAVADSLALHTGCADETLTPDLLNQMDGVPGRVSFGTALCGRDLFPVEALARCIASTVRRHSDLLVEVSFSPGSKRLRESLAEHASTWNCQIASEEILITNGCVEAFGLCLQAVAQPGDVIVVESPAYYGFLSTIARLGMVAIAIPFSPNLATACAEIERLAGERRVGACLLSTSVSNPSGVSLPNDVKRELVERLAHLRIPLIEDATFSDLHFEAGQRAAKSYDRAGNVLLCSSLSKTLSPGLRIGWVAAGRYHDATVSLKRTMSIGQPLVIQEGVADYLFTGGYRHHLRQLRKRCRSQVEETARIVHAHFPVGTHADFPGGGYLLWVRLPDGVSGDDLYRLAFREGITIAPGSLFAPDSRFLQYVRLNCGETIDDRRRDALIRLGDIATSLM